MPRSKRAKSTHLTSPATPEQLEITEVEVLPPDEIVVSSSFAEGIVVATTPKTPQSVRKQIRKPRNLPRTEPPLFTNKPIEMIATSAPIISATQAFLKPPDWSEYSQNRLYFQRHFGKGRYIEFSVLNNHKDQAEFVTSQAEREILAQYGVMAARLHAVFATYAALQSEPWKEPFYLRGTDLIKTLKIHNSNKFNKSQKLKAIAELAWVVGTLGAIIHWFEGDLDLCVRERSLLWIVSIQEYIQPNLDESTEDAEPRESIDEVVIRVQPGLWTQNFLNRQGAQQRKALYQYGLIPRQVFDIDPHRRKLATSMALYLIQNSRARPNGTYTIQSLIESILPMNDIDKALNDRRYAWKLRESIDNALLTLKDSLRVEIDFDQTTYPLWLRPVWSLPDELATLDTKERNQRLLGSKCLPDNYLSRYWFGAKLTFHLPSEIQDCLDEMEARRIEKTKLLSNSRIDSIGHSADATLLNLTISAALTGEVIKTARQSLNWTQADLAAKMGKSVSWVKLVESDRRRVVEKDQEVLHSLLNL
ncbi:hypothetical protein LEP3755_65370 (plasmid) [Leptolyngbya sp. NIES-3755]|nr:hypothetical protein LEP3755_65370 [Leptolyngbya sp. NIES-3755]